MRLPEEWRFSDYDEWISQDDRPRTETIPFFRSRLGIPEPDKYKIFVEEYQRAKAMDSKLTKYLFD